MLKSCAKLLQRVPSLPRALRIPLTLLPVLAFSACATPTAPQTPPAALLVGCLVDVTGKPEIDAPALEHALEECDARVAGLRTYFATVDGN